jgi:hypothetical protein
MVAGGGLILLLVSGVTWISARKFEKVSPYFWLCSALILFSLVGGVNYVLGACGFQLLRATDRASIMLACFALYFVFEQLTLWLPSRILTWVALLIIPFGIWDQVPKYPNWEEQSHRKSWNDFEKDRIFFPKLEAMLPKGAMIFELPVKDFPEAGTILEMGDYEHFRPILHSEKLRISYGTVKGRGDTEWQKECAGKGPAEMVEDLKKKGFEAILINRKAYEDRGELLRGQMDRIFIQPIMENDDFLVYRLTPESGGRR